MDKNQDEKEPKPEYEPFMGNYIKALTPNQSLIEKYNINFIYMKMIFNQIHFIQDKKNGVLM